ncbi:ArsR family transcriptional regulator [Thermococcus sp. GR7]|uniref:ArsR/SmtB family transcription factor n=1 Tax=unclassified Thermococcus TaxID=2627626 RepID=UPI0014306EE0|nr:MULTISPECIES: winged helix-turn-helix domain-containing protein [unclassified Thermococcus]NJE47575.1 ArsR family transcriptional regulator [Thermococcus sp. GR7]NJE79333.1 ArsR family transcriptional regulator [Thermococcus sp. GR4]NJF22469.1 ArsR family transcriptional regulator [Thermococcus sp. GR5]
MDYETIDIHDERAKELAQILMNDKAIAILHLLEDRALSMSEIARELNLPISTVSYHIDKMLKVGLVEVAGKKYGKRLQEVKLYSASDRPILLVPRKNVAKVKKKAVPGFEKLHVISLTIAGIMAAGVYKASTDLLSPKDIPTYSNTTQSGNFTVMEAGREITVLTANTTQGITTTPLMQTSASALPVMLSLAAFILTFLLVSYLLERRR